MFCVHLCTFGVGALCFLPLHSLCQGLILQPINWFFFLNKIFAIHFHLFIKHLLFKYLPSPRFLDLMLECNGIVRPVNPNYRIFIAHCLQGKLTQDKFDIITAGNNSCVL